MSDPQAYRLPAHVRPIQYDVHLHARVDEPRFRGEVRVRLDLREPTRRIVLHARDLDVPDGVLVVGGEPVAARARVDAAREVVELALAREVPVGEAELRLAFSGAVSRSMEGLYLSQDGPERCLATQCEETDARAIFPCFDEPAFKARLAWRVTTSPDATALANGPLLRIEDAPEGARTWTFAPTRPMSSYLAALCIGDLRATDATVVRGVPLRTWAIAGHETQGVFGRDLAARLLPWFEDYFDAPYHFDKYDQVAVPSFSAGAMENSGLVIFRRSLLLHDSATTSWRQEKLIARVVAHELAHQWFGNLVTMAWWDDIWLNESFAEWIAHKALDAVRPEERVWEDFEQGRARALAADALQSTHPVYAPVDTPAQATEMFDAITYEKGSNVLRMLEGFLGEEAFREGLRAYMREFAEANARGADLWRHLGRASGRPVERLMGSWLEQPGHPLVTFRLDAASRTLHVAQRRYFATPEAPDNDQSWVVPLVVRYRDGERVRTHRALLETRDASFELPLDADLAWLAPNAEAGGFYRSRLDDALLARLLAHVGELSPTEQACLLDDQWGLVLEGTLRVDGFLEAVGALLPHVHGASVLERALARLERLEEVLESSGDVEALARFRAWAGRRLRPAAARVGLSSRPGDTGPDRALRGALLRGLGGLARDEDARARAVAFADREAADPRGVDADLAGPAVALAARFGDARRFEKHLDVYRVRRAGAFAPEAAQRYLFSLTEFRDPALVARTLELLDDGTLPLEAAGPLLRTMFSLPHARAAAWGHLRSRWGGVRERLGDMWTGFLVEASGQLPAAFRDEMVRFYDANLEGVAQQSYARALEIQEERASFERRVQPGLVDWARAQTA